MWLRWLLGAVPNTLSLSRLVLGLAFAWIPVPWRLAVIAFATLSDMLDGAASRHWHVTSTAGRLLDPLADKVFVIGVVTTLWREGAITGWEVFLIALRDIVVLLGAASLALRRDWQSMHALSPTLLGKLTTAAQFGFFLSLVIWQERLLAVFVATAVLSGLAAADYARIFLTRTQR